MKVLLTGAAGQLGHALRQQVSAGVGLIATSPSGDGVRAGGVGVLLPLLLGDAEACRAAVRSLRPDWLHNGGAYTAVGMAESSPEMALAVNGGEPWSFAEALLGTSVHLLLVSTEFVFNGSQSHPYRPKQILIREAMAPAKMPGSIRSSSARAAPHHPSVLTPAAGERSSGRAASSISTARARIETMLERPNDTTCHCRWGIRASSSALWTRRCTHTPLPPPTSSARCRGTAIHYGRPSEHAKSWNFQLLATGAAAARHDVPLNSSPLTPQHFSRRICSSVTRMPAAIYIRALVAESSNNLIRGCAGCLPDTWDLISANSIIPALSPALRCFLRRPSATSCSREIAQKLVCVEAFYHAEQDLLLNLEAKSHVERLMEGSIAHSSSRKENFLESSSIFQYLPTAGVSALLIGTAFVQTANPFKSLSLISSALWLAQVVPRKPKSVVFRPELVSLPGPK